MSSNRNRSKSASSPFFSGRRKPDLSVPSWLEDKPKPSSAQDQSTSRRPSQPSRALSDTATGNEERNHERREACCDVRPTPAPRTRVSSSPSTDSRPQRVHCYHEDSFVLLSLYTKPESPPPSTTPMTTPTTTPASNSTAQPIPKPRKRSLSPGLRSTPPTLTEEQFPSPTKTGSTFEQHCTPIKYESPSSNSHHIHSDHMNDVDPQMSLIPVMDLSLAPRAYGITKLELGAASAVVNEDNPSMEDEDEEADAESPSNPFPLSEMVDPSNGHSSEGAEALPPAKPPRSRPRSSPSPSSSPVVGAQGRTMPHSQSALGLKQLKKLHIPSPFSDRKSKSSTALSPEAEKERKTKKHVFNPKDKVKVLPYLKSQDIKPNMTNEHGDTPVIVYVKNHVKNRMEYLRAIFYNQKELDLDARDWDGNTPLHIAAMRKDHSYGKTLIAFGARHNLLNSKGKTPADLATGELAELLNNLSTVPVVEEADAVLSLESNRDLLSDINNMRLGELMLEENIPKLVNWFEQEQEQRAQSMASITDGDTAFVQKKQEDYVMRWKSTANLVKPGSRILFLDGGGIRGLAQIEMLIELERRTGRKIVDLFDWFVGTSIGAVVALGMIYSKLSLEEIRRLLFLLKDEVFGVGGTYLNIDRKSRKLEKFLRKWLGEVTLNSIAYPKVMVCVVDKKENLKVKFFNNFMDDDELTDVPAWLACRASSAAPLYFTAYKDYIDGGVLANNPCEYAMAEIQRYYQARPYEIAPKFSLAVSVGTGVYPTKKIGDIDLFGKGYLDPRKLVGRAKELFEMLGKAITESEDTADKFAMQCKYSRHQTHFFRFNPQLLEMIQPVETDNDMLENMVLKTKCYMAAPEIIDRMSKAVSVFRQLAQYHRME